jgi:hypothetical protein
MKVIRSYTDDVIHFSKELGDELVHYTNQERAKLPRRQRKSTPVIVSADFSKVSDMFPDRKDYSDWDTMFVRATPPAKRKWWPWHKSTQTCRPFVARYARAMLKRQSQRPPSPSVAIEVFDPVSG